MRIPNSNSGRAIALLAETRLLATLFCANLNAFGRTGSDKCVLYATFVGGTSGVARIDTTGQGFCCSSDDDDED